MTVCIAAICTQAGQPMIVGAADRMLTTGLVEFEQPQPKIFQLGPHSVAMIAGNVDAESAIATATQRTVLAKGTTDIQEIAALYAEEHAAYRRRRAEDAILKPIGLDLALFHSQQATMRPSELAALRRQLQEYEIPDRASAIIAGVDDVGMGGTPTGCHLYVVQEPGTYSCKDSIGYAVIGGGFWHSAPQFMFAQYTKAWSAERAMFLTYLAKKRAEVTPGVGEQTDMMWITSNPRQVTKIGDQHIGELEKIYRQVVRGEQRARGRADQKVDAYLKRLTQEAQHRQQQEAAKPKGDEKQQLDQP